MTEQETYDALASPFLPNQVRWRIGGGNKPLAYIDARDVMDRLDKVVGPSRWRNDFYSPMTGIMVCKLSLWMQDAMEWVWKEDGAGETKVESEKGILSDAFKRAAVKWGVGRYLYDIDVKAKGFKLESPSFISDKERRQLGGIHDEYAEQYGATQNRTEFTSYNMLRRAISLYTPSQAIAFSENNQGLIPLLPVKFRNNVKADLASIGATAEAAE